MYIGKREGKQERERERERERNSRILKKLSLSSDGTYISGLFESLGLFC